MEEKALHDRVKSILYSLTGITLSENKDIMISNRLHKLKRDTKFHGSVIELLDMIEHENKHVTVFINSFTTNKTHFFREEFHFEDLRDRVLPQFVNAGKSISMYCSASSTGEEPYSMVMTLLEVQKSLGRRIQSQIIATDIDTNALQYAANGVYRYNKASKEFPEWIKPPEYFMKRVQKSLSREEILIKVKKELQERVQFQIMNLSDAQYPFKDHQFDVVFCRNVLIYFSVEDQNKILKKLFKHLKVGGTLYLGHSESPHDLAPYIDKIGQNIFIKKKDII